jgi:hypothetical protein
MKKKRVNLDLTPKAVEMLERLQIRLEGESRAAVIRDALKLFDYLYRRAEQGERVFVGSDKDTAIEQDLFAINRKL